MANYREKLYSAYLTNGFEEQNSVKFDDFYNSRDYNYSQILPKDMNSTILDIGCGMGHFLYYLNKKGYKNFLGVDIGKEQIQFCRENITDKVKHIDDTFKFLGENASTYDVIVMNDVIEHFKKEEVLPILESMNKSLKGNGLLILKTCNMSNLFANSSFYFDFTHEVGFTEMSMIQVLKASGFYEIKCHGEKLYINNPIKRFIFNIIRFVYEKITDLIIYIDRPGDSFPTITCKNFIAVARKKIS